MWIHFSCLGNRLPHASGSRLRFSEMSHCGQPVKTSNAPSIKPRNLRANHLSILPKQMLACLTHQRNIIVHQPWFHHVWLQLPMINWILKISSGKFQKFITLKLRDVLSISVTTYPSVPFLSEISYTWFTPVSNVCTHAVYAVFPIVT